MREWDDEMLRSDQLEMEGEWDDGVMRTGHGKGLKRPLSADVGLGHCQRHAP